MASEAVYQEWQDTNRDINFPFMENTSLVGENDIELPKDAIVDAIFYPIDLEGFLYLSSIDPTTNTMVVSDSTTGQVKGTSTATFGSGVHYFYDQFERHVGTIVTGPGISELATSFTFAVGSAVFSAAVVLPQNQPGVRGVRLPDGTVLTGEITFVGRDGVQLTTNNDSTLRVDVVGAPGSPDLLDPIVKNIVVYGECVLNVTQNGNVVNISSAVENPQDICTAKANIINPDGTFPLEDQDPCGDPPTLPTWLPCPALLIPDSTEPPCDHGGYFFFNAISPILDIKALEYPGVIVSITGINSSNSNVEDVASQLPPRSMGALKFSMKS